MTTETRPSILIADDEYVISRCLSFMFKKEGFDCRAVVDGEAALEAMRPERASHDRNRATKSAPAEPRRHHRQEY